MFIIKDIRTKLMNSRVILIRVYISKYEYMLVGYAW